MSGGGGQGAVGFLGRRLGFYLLAAWVALTLNFLIPRLMPGDPATVMFARFQGELEPEAIDALRAAFGLTDAPLHEQYLAYVSALARGDLGLSVAFFPATVTEVMSVALLWTLFLAGTAAVLSFVLGTALGALAAWRRGGWLDTLAPPMLAFLGAFPYFWTAMAAAWVLGFQLGWFPMRHAYDAGVQPGFTLAFVYSVVSHAILPAGTMVLAGLGGWVFAMRNNMIGVLGEESLTYARARGLGDGRIWLHYAVRPAALPSLAGFGMALGFVMSGALLTEIVFAYPGQGYLLITAVRAQDYPLMQGLFLSITFAVLLGNWLVDVMTVVLDPRTRT